MTVDLRVVPVVALGLALGSNPVRAASGSERAAPRVALATASRARRPPLGPQELERVREMLASADEAVASTAARALADTGAANAAMPLVEALAVGAVPAVSVAAIDGLKALRDPSAIEILELYAGHRSPDIRRHAVEALGIFADARVVPTLMRTLADRVPEVRAAAAQALATRGEKAASPRLLALLKRNDAAVAGPLGALAPVDTVGAILDLKGAVGDDTLAMALAGFLKRQDVSEASRMDIVKTLAAIPDPASTAALTEYVAALPRDRRASRVLAQKIVQDRNQDRNQDRGQDRSNEK